MTNKTFIIVGVIAGLGIVGGVWFFIQSSSGSPSGTLSGEFGTGTNRTTQGTNSNTFPSQTPGTAGSEASQQKIFRLAEGPIAGATFIQTLRPTTTLVRFVKADNGHVQDLVLDSPGAIPKALSNTTIPGVIRTVWAEGGGAAVVQYADNEIIKTAYLGFPATTTGTSTLNRVTRLQFLPDGIVDIAVSPQGDEVAYLLRTASGVTGYIANSNGTGSRNAFSIPLSEILISWPSQNRILAHTKSAANYPGMVFSVNVQNGAVTPLFFAEGVTAIANENFSQILYQTANTARASYIRNIEEGSDLSLSLDPIPEKCTWSSATTASIFCASPLQAVPANYLDVWHQGRSSVPDTIIAFNPATGGSSAITTPGGRDGGTPADIAQIAVSPDGRYLLYIDRDDRSLWGVRLEN